MKKLIRLTLGFAFSGLFLWLFLRHLSLQEMQNAFNETNLPLIGLAVVSFFIGYGCRIERLRIMLIQENPALTWKTCAGPLLACFATNNVLPLRAGDLLRAFAFNRRLGISTATSLTTMVAERMFDLLVLIFLLGLALIWFGMESSTFFGIGGGGLLIAGLLIAFLLSMPSVFEPIVFRLCRVISRYAPKVGDALLAQFQKVFTALGHISKGHIMLRLSWLSLLAWVFEGFVFWLVALALPSLTNHLAAWLALPVGTLVTAIPSAPGYVGTFDYFTAQAMMTLDNPPAAAAAFAFIVHIVLWLPSSIAGGLYLLMHPVGKPQG
ncbi:MAG: lysylphosphatidylglycerol synthase transmembrane domain-containing protein [Pseudohongiellaceae bacterium]